MIKLRLQNSDIYIEVNVDHAYELSDPKIYQTKLSPKIQEAIGKMNLKCDGCGKLLSNTNWIGVNHRPKSAIKEIEILRVEKENTGEVYSEGVIEQKEIWNIFLFCFDTKDSCVAKWIENRPK